jgi:hypothetical protein
LHKQHIPFAWLFPTRHPAIDVLPIRIFIRHHHTTPCYIETSDLASRLGREHTPGSREVRALGHHDRVKVRTRLALADLVGSDTVVPWMEARALCKGPHAVVEVVVVPEDLVVAEVPFDLRGRNLFVVWIFDCAVKGSWVVVNVGTENVDPVVAVVALVLLQARATVKYSLRLNIIGHLEYQCMGNSILSCGVFSSPAACRLKFERAMIYPLVIR